MLRNKKACYDIKASTYHKVPTGEIDSRGKKIYATKGNPKTVTYKNTNFSELKKRVYKKSQSENDVFVNYSKPAYTVKKLSPRLKSVVKSYDDGSKDIIYFNALKK